MDIRPSLEKPDEEDTENTEDSGYDSVKPGVGQKSKEIAKFWKSEVEDYERFSKMYYERGVMILDRFRDKRNKIESDTARRVNVLWSNVKILAPALYNRAPIPNIDRKFLDRDPRGRLSAQILERTVRNELEHNGLHRAVSRSVLDYLLVGRGQVWVRYEPVIGLGKSIPGPMHNDVQAELDEIYDEEDNDKYNLLDNETNKELPPEEKLDETQEEQLETTGEQLLAESVPVDHVDWKDFYYFPANARTWDEVQAVGKKVYISKKEARTRFGEEIGKTLCNYVDTQSGKKDYEKEDTSYESTHTRSICIIEIWNKSDKKVYWICPDYEYLCDVKDDPLRLSKFFPCPEPISSTLTNESLIPSPDYIQYQDQALQIDELTLRIARLVEICRIAGAYDAANPSLARILTVKEENKLVPVDNWALFGEKGGIQGAISFLPLKEIINVIDTLTKSKSLAMQDLDLITGITDLQRGTTDSRETLGGIRLKSNTTGSRLSQRQTEIAEFAKEILVIVTEIVAEHFSEKTLIEASGILHEEALQPDVVMQEYQETLRATASPAMPAAPMAAPPTPVGPPMGAPPMGAPPMGAPPMGAPPMGAPPMGAPPMEPALPTGLFAPPTPTTDELIAKKLDSAISLLRDDVKLSYRIDIETDSTIFGDAAQERKDATEFIGSVSKFISTVSPMLKELPEAVPLFGALLRFGVRKFRTGRDLESTIDVFIATMENKIKAQKDAPPPVDPKIEYEKLKQQGEIQSQQFEAQQRQQDAAAQAQNDQRDAQKQAENDQRQALIEQQRLNMTAQAEQRRQQFEEKKMMFELAQLERMEQYQIAEHNRKMHELQAKHVTGGTNAST